LNQQEMSAFWRLGQEWKKNKHIFYLASKIVIYNEFYFNNF
jgi:hypothetical protein